MKEEYKKVFAYIPPVRVIFELLKVHHWKLDKAIPITRSVSGSEMSAFCMSEMLDEFSDG